MMMKNEDKYMEVLECLYEETYGIDDDRIAVLWKTNRPCHCIDTDCNKCLFANGCSNNNYELEYDTWAASIYTPKSPYIVNAPVLVSNDGFNWTVALFVQECVDGVIVYTGEHNNCTDYEFFEFCNPITF